MKFFLMALIFAILVNMILSVPSDDKKDGEKKELEKELSFKDWAQSKPPAEDPKKSEKRQGDSSSQSDQGKETDNKRQKN